MKPISRIYFLSIILGAIIFIAGCSSSKPEKEEVVLSDSAVIVTENDIVQREKIIQAAITEQNNPMYSPSVDTTFLYWLDNKISRLKNYTKCNVFVLNVLKKANYQTPDVYALSRDLYNDSLFNDVLPIVRIERPEELVVGDLIIWQKHVLIFEALISKKKKVMIKGIWAGTSESDNGDNVKNNVNYGKYELKKGYKVRRPQKQN